MSKKFDFAAGLKKDSQVAVHKGVSKDIVLAPTPPTSRIVNEENNSIANIPVRKKAAVQPSIFLSFACPRTEEDRLEDLTLWLRSKGAKVSRSKVIFAAIRQMQKNETTLDYVKKFISENPDPRRRK